MRVGAPRVAVDSPRPLGVRPRVRLSTHCVERCRQRGISRRTLMHVVHRPFARGDAGQPGRRWAVGPALCGAPQIWRWVKVIYERRDAGVRQLVTAYPLDRRSLGSADDLLLECEDLTTGATRTG